MKERLILNGKEQKRLMLLNEVEKGKMVVREVEGLAHGNLGRKPVHTLGEEIQKQVDGVGPGEVSGVQSSAFDGDVVGAGEVKVIRPSVRRILFAAGMRS